MRRFDRRTDSLFSIENSTVDPNKFYSILLDARAAAVSENMCDIAEKLLQMEKENSRNALDQLTRLKSNLFSGTNPTIDLLITFYEDKMGILGEKEEHLKKVSLDSRSLLEDKRRKDEEIATVKQQVAECSKELDSLTRKLDSLKIREQELTLIEHQLREELNRNENEIVNGLYEIILRQEDVPEATCAVEEGGVVETAVAEITAVQHHVEEVRFPETTSISAVFEPPVIPAEKTIAVGSPIAPPALTPTPQAPFPKSVVKTAAGRIIGEYHYDARVYKNERHYIFNTRFFTDELLSSTAILRKGYDAGSFSDLVQMIQDAHKRISDNKQLHFEVATNEILNEKTIKRLWQDAKLRSFDEVERFGARLKAKIEALGNNYESMLTEQMQRCIKKS